VMPPQGMPAPPPSGKPPGRRLRLPPPRREEPVVPTPPPARRRVRPGLRRFRSPPETAPGTAGNAPAESRETPGAAREGDSGAGSAGPAENTAPAAGDGAPGRELPVTAPAQAAPEAVLPVEPVIILFNPEEAVLLPAARTALDRLAETLKGRDLSKLTISGHCALFGSETERQELSLKRAEAAAAYLRSRGLNLPPAVRITGEGGTRPLTSDPARQDINRRVEIRL